jgi:hypothetical protein
MEPKTASLFGVLSACAITVAAIVSACGGDNGSTTGDMGGEEAGVDAATTGVDADDSMDAAIDSYLYQPPGCDSYPGHDPSSLPGSGCCTSGPSHCVPTSDIPPALDNAFSTCSGGLCVPDPIISKGSEYVPTACNTKVVVWQLQGVCLSECITLVANNMQKNLLHQETCGQGELCVPCTDPTTNKPTGACSITSLVCGDGGAIDAGSTDAGSIMCPYTGPPIIDPSMFPACSPACNGAHCVPAAIVPTADQSQLAACMSNGSPGFCAPDSFIASAGNAVPKTCTSVAGSEGRCLSTCLPAVQAEEQLLPQDICAADEKCVPCYNPTATDPTQPTGACSLACDKPTKPPTLLTCPYSGPPVIDPSVFPDCAPACGGAHCVPSSLIPMADQSQLATCTINGGPGFCAPDSLTASGGEGVPKTCTSVAGAEGRCLSTCLPEISGQASLLPQDVCAADERCAPCYNPVAADPTAPTGACSLACDKPAKPPTMLSCPWTGPPIIDPNTLPACDNGGCGGAHCIPASEVPASVQSQLAPCNGGAGFCAPDPIISTADNYVPPTCDPFPGSGAAGRCLSTCLPAVAKEVASGTLVQSSCTGGDYCVPCNDPFTGVSTGACTLACDTPPNPPFTFPKCCDDGTGTQTGTCVPASQVPASEQSELSGDGNGNSSPCPTNGANYLCVPDEYLPAPYNSIPLQFCQATLLNYCGTCVSQCIVNSGLNLLGSDDCAANHKCVPCTGFLGQPNTPGCSQFCTGGAVCGNSCNTDMDCSGVCGVCSNGNCDTQ